MTLSDRMTLGGGLAEPQHFTAPEGHEAPSAVETRQLEEVFADLKDFEVGELSRLCISKDYF